MGDRGAGRQDDVHVCMKHGAGCVAGPCSSDVLVNARPLARQGDPITCPGASDSLFTGTPTVLVNSRMAARQFDRGFHADTPGILLGSPNVFIGGPTLSVLGNLEEFSVMERDWGPLVPQVFTAWAQGRTDPATVKNARRYWEIHSRTTAAELAGWYEQMAPAFFRWLRNLSGVAG